MTGLLPSSFGARATPPAILARLGPPFCLGGISREFPRRLRGRSLYPPIKFGRWRRPLQRKIGIRLGKGDPRPPRDNQGPLSDWDNVMPPKVITKGPLLRIRR